MSARVPRELRRAARLLEAARREGRDALLEPEGYALLRELGIPAPRHVFIRRSAGVPARVFSFPGTELVLKVVSPDILHKSDVGGVRIVPKTRRAAEAALRGMKRRFRRRKPAGYLLCERLAYDASFGAELLLGARWTQDFGPIVTFGPGGIHTEFLAESLKPDRSAAIGLPGRLRLRDSAVHAPLAGLRGQKPRADLRALSRAAARLGALAAALMPDMLTEIEINPLVAAGGRLTALDILVRLGEPPEHPAPPRPIRKIGRLLKPRSAAVIGVSEKMNAGRIILRNMIRDGFDRGRLYVVKKGARSIDGCRCVPDPAGLPERVDLAVLTVPAAAVSDAAAELIVRRKAESIIVIPGGLEEKSGGVSIVSRMRSVLAGSRGTAWGGPVINGGNCLGVRSAPGRYDTMFIQSHKKSVRPAAGGERTALISQSGAFAVSKLDKLAGFRPRYSVSIGNQTDLTIGDYLTYLADDPSIELFAVYVEGFKPLDGLRFLKAASRIVRAGRKVLLYRAGRTSEGRKASASHTASIAEDYPVARALAARHGVTVAETLSDFEDLVRLHVLLRGKRMRGPRIGAVSNAGFECVAVADNLGGLSLPSFGSRTARRLRAAFRKSRIDSIVDVHNPLDLTPMTGDAGYEEVVRAVLADQRTDAAVVGCVPLAPGLNTLPSGKGHAEDLRRKDSVASRLVRLGRRTRKPLIVVVDSGELYDPLARFLEDGRLPVFREIDRALRLLGLYYKG